MWVLIFDVGRIHILGNGLKFGGSVQRKLQYIYIVICIHAVSKSEKNIWIAIGDVWAGYDLEITAWYYNIDLHVSSPSMRD
jgi:hypothetical protein